LHCIVWQRKYLHLIHSSPSAVAEQQDIEREFLMALNIKNPEVERLTAQLAILTENTKTGAVGQAVRKELDRLKSGATSEQASAELLVALLLATGARR